MTQKKTLLSIKYIPNNKAINDIVFKVHNPNVIKKFDSFDLVNSIKSGVDKIVKKNLKTILEYWIKSIDKLNEKGCQFLPIDFSNNYLGVFKVQNKQGLLSFKYGFLIGDKTKGFDIIKINNINTENHIFKPDNKFLPFIIDKNQVIEDLKLSIQSL